MTISPNRFLASDSAENNVVLFEEEWTGPWVRLGRIAPIVGGIAPTRHEVGAGRRKAGRVMMEAMRLGF